MKRILLLVTVASMLAVAMALSGVAQAAKGSNKANAQCKAEAIRTLQPGFKPSNYTFIGGTAGNDRLDGLGSTDGPGVFCGFGGDDLIGLAEGDIFLGGAGNDVVDTNYGTFYGGPGDDTVGSGQPPVEEP